MINTKDNKGITLVALIITVVVLSIIAGVSIYIGSNDIQNSKDHIAIAELEEVKHMVGEAYLLYKKTNNINYLHSSSTVSTTEINSIAEELGVMLVTIPANPNTPGTTAYDQYELEIKYYRLTPTDLTNIGVENSDDTYIVNYITGEVINETKMKTSTDEPLYTYIRSTFNNNDITAF